jgi:hypothetical protein
MFLLNCPSAFFPKADKDNTNPLYSPLFYFIVRISTLFPTFLLYCRPFYFIVRLSTLLSAFYFIVLLLEKKNLLGKVVQACFFSSFGTV